MRSLIHMILLTLGLMGCMMSCTPKSPYLGGVSGPVTWHATDLMVIDQPVAGTPGELYTFVLVLQEVQGTAIVFTHLDTTTSQPGVHPGVSRQSTVLGQLWKLPAHGELRQPFSTQIVCPGGHCLEWGPTAPWWHIVLTGVTAHGQPVHVVIDLKLPPHPDGSERTLAKHALALLSPAPVPAALRDSMPIQVVDNAILVRAVLNQKESVTLLLDTGANRTIVTPDVAQRLQISPAPDVPRRTTLVVGGQKVGYSLARLATIAVGHAVVEDLAVGIAPVIPGVPFVDGLLGGDFLERFTMTIDHATSRLRLIPKDTRPIAPPETSFANLVPPDVVPVQIINNVIFVPAMLNQKEPVLLLLDTGANKTLITPATAQRLGLYPRLDAPKQTTAVFGGKRIEFPLVHLPLLAVGEARVPNLQVGVFPALPEAPFVDGLLGGDFLEHFMVTLDRANSWLKLEPRL